jgi:mono/diheme cytochrome c family protein
MSNLQFRRALSASLTVVLAGALLSTLLFAFAEENQLGAQVYEKKCTMCHGKDGVGDTKAGKMMKTPDINAGDWKNGKTVADLAKTLREGLGKMPKYEGKLSDEELEAVAQYTVTRFVK